MSYWTDAELERFGFFLLDGAKSPGTIVGFNINGVVLNYDSTQGFGLSGEFLRFTGLGLAEIGFIVRLVDAEDRAAEDRAEWQRATAPPPQGRPDRIRTVQHPVIDRIPATTNRWYLQAVPTPIPATNEGGGVTVEYSFKNNRKPIPQVGKPAPPKNAQKPKEMSWDDQLLEGMGILLTGAIAADKNGIPPAMTGIRNAFNRVTRR
ncbi:hypothetical protein [Polyangium sp. 6x1]|uniref:hypothetical protein n=1 Tax=Polyangium sp. 6x1 TaxID=3042689 RepID=UPI00248272C1|nr:hypothetical protein [Polyangium sp. 6x1]MDI1444207.1 hypothetical protein [Polyangium sp. 6x1]